MVRPLASNFSWDNWAFSHLLAIIAGVTAHVNAFRITGRHGDEDGEPLTESRSQQVPHTLKKKLGWAFEAAREFLAVPLTVLSTIFFLLAFWSGGSMNWLLMLLMAVTGGPFLLAFVLAKQLRAPHLFIPAAIVLQFLYWLGLLHLAPWVWRHLRARDRGQAGTRREPL